MNSFLRGDRVVFTAATGEGSSRAVHGDIGTVLASYDDFVEVRMSGGDVLDLFYYRFEHYEEPKTTPELGLVEKLQAAINAQVAEIAEHKEKYRAAQRKLSSMKAAMELIANL